MALAARWLCCLCTPPRICSQCNAWGESSGQQKSQSSQSGLWGVENKSNISFCKAFLKNFLPDWCWLGSPQDRVKDMHAAHCFTPWYFMIQHTSCSVHASWLHPKYIQSWPCIDIHWCDSPPWSDLKYLQQHVEVFPLLKVPVGENICRTGPWHQAYGDVKDTATRQCQFIKVFAFPKFRQLKQKQIVGKD